MATGRDVAVDIRKVQAKPEDAMGVIQGLYYKLGVHNKPYYWTGDCWQQSTLSAQGAVRLMAREKRYRWMII